VRFLSKEFADACARADAAASVDRSSSRKPWSEGLITAAALQTKQFKPVRIILPELIPEGVTVLAGKPKIGKSFLALDVCIAVAAGRFVLGETKPVAGDALYLALEDSQRRLKKRMDKLMQAQAWPERLQLHTEWKRLDQGGLDDLVEWCKAHPEARLIWIDTLVKIRPIMGRNEQTYAYDYRAIEGLQRIAGQYQVGIVLNHHLRKMASEDDAMDDVSGTLGLTAAADTIIVMKRHSGLTKIFVRGRDLEEAGICRRVQPHHMSLANRRRRRGRVPLPRTADNYRSAETSRSRSDGDQRHHGRDGAARPQRDEIAPAQDEDRRRGDLQEGALLTPTDTRCK